MVSAVPLGSAWRNRDSGTERSSLSPESSPGASSSPVNIGGVFEPHARPDLFADFLFAEEYPPELVSLVRRCDPQRGAIKSIVLGLDPSIGGFVAVLSRDAATTAALVGSSRSGTLQEEVSSPK